MTRADEGFRTPVLRFDGRAAVAAVIASEAKQSRATETTAQVTLDCFVASLLAMTKPGRRDLPDGQNRRLTAKPVHPSSQKYSASRFPQIKLTTSAVPLLMRGVS